MVMKREKIIIDEPPQEVQKNDTPMIMTIGPQLTMICTSALTLYSYVNNYLEGKADKSRFIISVTTIVVGTVDVVFVLIL